MKNKNEFIKYISALLLFGMNGIVASNIKLSSYEIVFTRTLIGSLFLILVFIISKRKVKLPDCKLHLIYVAVSGAAMGTSWMFLYEAYKLIGVGIASLFYYCGPVIVMVLSPILFKEKFTWPKLMGFFVVIIGMLCLNSQIFFTGKSMWGLMFGIISAFMYAAMVIFNIKAKSITGLENSMWQMIAGLLTVFVFLCFKNESAFNIKSESIIPILILGIVNTGIGCYLYFSSISKLPVQTVAVCGYIEPLSAVVFSVLFLRERINAVQIVGTILVIAGAAFGELYGSSNKQTNQ